MKKKFESELLMSCYETAQSLHEIGAISDAEMREYDEDCLAHDDKMSPASGVSRNKRITPAFTSHRS
ncbi:hypothetical protein FACS189498_3470 [Spirochaetia bacterium]|nr:hypothetical protein FACS189498_3470 [Spirochaetia bacterium]